MTSLNQIQLSIVQCLKIYLLSALVWVSGEIFSNNRTSNHTLMYTYPGFQPNLLIFIYTTQLIEYCFHIIKIFSLYHIQQLICTQIMSLPQFLNLISHFLFRKRNHFRQKFLCLLFFPLLFLTLIIQVLVHLLKLLIRCSFI